MVNRGKITFIKVIPIRFLVLIGIIAVASVISSQKYSSARPGNSGLSTAGLAASESGST